MPDTNPTIVLVTPVYRDSRRLSDFGPELAQVFAESSHSIKWVVADDGSGEAETARLKDLIQIFRKTYPYVEFFEKGQHLGKGGTVRGAWEAYCEADWLAFVDADGSVEAKSLMALIDAAVARGPGHAILASRMRTPETQVIQKPLRKVAHHTFAMIGRNLLRLPVQDLQCGAKVVDSAAFQAIAPKLLENGFAFDAELLVALNRHGVKLVEVPVDWAEKSGGSVKPLVVAWPMLAALFRVRGRRVSGVYDPTPTP